MCFFDLMPPQARALVVGVGGDTVRLSACGPTLETLCVVQHICQQCLEILLILRVSIHDRTGHIDFSVSENEKRALE
jgi:hypothetical protein